MSTTVYTVVEVEGGIVQWVKAFDSNESRELYLRSTWLPIIEKDWEECRPEELPEILTTSTDFNDYFMTLEHDWPDEDDNVYLDTVEIMDTAATEKHLKEVTANGVF